MQHEYHDIRHITNSIWRSEYKFKMRSLLYMRWPVYINYVRYSVSSVRIVSLVRMVSLFRMVSLVRMVSYVGHSCTNVTKGKLYGSQDSDHAIVHLGLNVSSSAHNCGCVVDGGNAMTAIWVLLLLLLLLLLFGTQALDALKLSTHPIMNTIIYFRCVYIGREIALLTHSKCLHFFFLSLLRLT